MQKINFPKYSDRTLLTQGRDYAGKKVLLEAVPQEHSCMVAYNEYICIYMRQWHQIINMTKTIFINENFQVILTMLHIFL